MKEGTFQTASLWFDEPWIKANMVYIICQYAQKGLASNEARPLLAKFLFVVFYSISIFES